MRGANIKMRNEIYCKPEIHVQYLLPDTSISSGGAKLCVGCGNRVTETLCAPSCRYGSFAPDENYEGYDGVIFSCSEVDFYCKTA